MTFDRRWPLLGMSERVALRQDWQEETSEVYARSLPSSDEGNHIERYLLVSLTVYSEGEWMWNWSMLYFSPWNIR